MEVADRRLAFRSAKPVSEVSNVAILRAIDFFVLQRLHLEEVF